MQADKLDNADTKTTEQPSIGELIRLAREDKILSQEELSKKLNLDLSLISNLENNQFDALPPPAFIRGYIRACAKLLEQNADQWIDTYLLSTRSDDPKPARLKSFNFRKADSSHPFFRSITILVITITIALASYWWFTEKDGRSLFYTDTASPVPAESSVAVLPPKITTDAGKKQEESPAVESTSSQSEVTTIPIEKTETATTTALVIPKASDETESITDNPNSVNQSPITPIEPSNTETAASPASLPPEKKIINVAINNDPASAVLATPISTPSTATEETETVTPEQNEIIGNDNLVLKTDTKSWVEVYDDNGHRLMFDMQTNTNERQLRGQAPFRIFLGDATGMSVTINGYDIGKIPYHPTTKIARFYIHSDGTVRK